LLLPALLELAFDDNWYLPVGFSIYCLDTSLIKMDGFSRPGLLRLKVGSLTKLIVVTYWFTCS